MYRTFSNGLRYVERGLGTMLLTVCLRGRGPCTHVINYPRPSPTFPCGKRQKAGLGLGKRLKRSSHVLLIGSQQRIHVYITAILLPYKMAVNMRKIVYFEYSIWISKWRFQVDFWISKWRFQVDFWISKWISAFHLNRYYSEDKAKIYS